MGDIHGCCDYVLSGFTGFMPVEGQITGRDAPASQRLPMVNPVLSNNRHPLTRLLSRFIVIETRSTIVRPPPPPKEGGGSISGPSGQTMDLVAIVRQLKGVFPHLERDTISFCNVLKYLSRKDRFLAVDGTIYCAPIMGVDGPRMPNGRFVGGIFGISRVEANSDSRNLSFVTKRCVGSRKSLKAW